MDDILKTALNALLKETLSTMISAAVADAMTQVTAQLNGNADAVAALVDTVGQLTADLKKFDDRVTDLEDVDDAVSDLERKVDDIAGTAEDIRSDLSLLEERVDGVTGKLNPLENDELCEQISQAVSDSMTAYTESDRFKIDIVSTLREKLA